MPFVIILTPFVLLAALVLWPPGYGKTILRTGPLLLTVIAALSSLHIEVEGRLLSAIAEPGGESIPGKKSDLAQLKYLRVPIKLIRAGIKLASLLPNDVQGKVDGALKEKGISLDFSQINEENLEEIVESLRDLTVDVEGQERVRIYCE